MITLSTEFNKQADLNNTKKVMVARLYYDDTNYMGLATTSLVLDGEAYLGVISSVQGNSAKWDITKSNAVTTSAPTLTLAEYTTADGFSLLTEFANNTYIGRKCEIFVGYEGMSVADMLSLYDGTIDDLTLKNSSISIKLKVYGIPDIDIAGRLIDFDNQTIGDTSDTDERIISDAHNKRIPVCFGKHHFAPAVPFRRHDHTTSGKGVLYSAVNEDVYNTFNIASTSTPTEYQPNAKNNDAKVFFEDDGYFVPIHQKSFSHESVAYPYNFEWVSSITLGIHQVKYWNYNEAGLDFESWGTVIPIGLEWEGDYTEQYGGAFEGEISNPSYGNDGHMAYYIRWYDFSFADWWNIAYVFNMPKMLKTGHKGEHRDFDIHVMSDDGDSYTGFLFSSKEYTGGSDASNMTTTCRFYDYDILPPTDKFPSNTHYPPKYDWFSKSEIAGSQYTRRVPSYGDATDYEFNFDTFDNMLGIGDTDVPTDESQDFMMLNRDTWNKKIGIVIEERHIGVGLADAKFYEYFMTKVGSVPFSKKSNTYIPYVGMTLAAADQLDCITGLGSNYTLRRPYEYLEFIARGKFDTPIGDTFSTIRTDWETFYPDNELDYSGFSIIKSTTGKSLLSKYMKYMPYTCYVDDMGELQVKMFQKSYVEGDVQGTIDFEKCSKFEIGLTNQTDIIAEISSLQTHNTQVGYQKDCHWKITDASYAYDFWLAGNTTDNNSLIKDKIEFPYTSDTQPDIVSDIPQHGTWPHTILKTGDIGGLDDGNYTWGEVYNLDPDFDGWNSGDLIYWEFAEENGGTISEDVDGNCVMDAGAMGAYCRIGQNTKAYGSNKVVITVESLGGMGSLKVGTDYDGTPDGSISTTGEHTITLSDGGDLYLWTVGQIEVTLSSVKYYWKRLVDGLVLECDADVTADYVFDDATSYQGEDRENRANAGYILNQWGNRHRTISLNLPELDNAKYEIGDIVMVENCPYSLLGLDIKGFNGNTTDFTTTVNGQTVYAAFIVTDIKKSHSGVDIKLFNLHNLEMEIG